MRNASLQVAVVAFQGIYCGNAVGCFYALGIAEKLSDVTPRGPLVSREREKTMCHLKN